MPHHVYICEVAHLNTGHTVEDSYGLDQPALTAYRQIDLRHIPSNHGFAAITKPRQKHLHLLAGGVLRLIQNDKRVVERASPHKCQRCNFYLPTIHQQLRALHIQQITQRIVQRPQVRVHLVLHGARQKTQLLTRLDGRTAQHDTLDLLIQQRFDRHRHRQVGLACSGGADAKDHVFVPNGVQIALLRDTLGHHRTRLTTDNKRVLQDIFYVGLLVVAQHLQTAQDVLAVYAASLHVHLMQLRQ